MNIYALDTNIVSYYLRENEIVISKFNELLHNNDKIAIPPFVYFENIDTLKTTNWMD